MVAAATKEVRIEGRAAVYNTWTTLYAGKGLVVREVIRKGAFARALKENQNVRALLNHNENYVLGTTRAGTLLLSDDGIGLAIVAVPPDTQTVRDLVITPIRRGDIDGMSFAFVPRLAAKVVRTENKDGSLVIDRGGDRITIRYAGNREVQERELLDVDLLDVSAVTYPQYAGTALAVRNAVPAPIRDSYRQKYNAAATARTADIRRWLEETKTGKRGR